MKIQALHIGEKVRHPQYGAGTVKALNEHTVEILFGDGARTLAPETSGIEPAEPQARIEGLELPLGEFVREVLEATAEHLGLEKPESDVTDLGTRWHAGRMVLHPADPTLQTKEIPVEVFFHKLVGIRNQLRVLEQKINAHSGLNDGEKVELQQYITRCYGSLTTFNFLFKNKADQFSSKAS
jgi:hypothetical protein